MTQEKIPHYFSEFLKEFREFKTDFTKRLDKHGKELAELKEDMIVVKAEIVKINRKLDIHMEAIAEIKVEITIIKTDIFDIRQELKKKVDKEDIRDLRVYIGEQNRAYPPIFA